MNGAPPGLILVVDLSASLYIALLDPECRLSAARVREQGIRGEAVHDLLDDCLTEARAAPGDIASLCVGTGPGSFTGIRVAVSMSQGLAFAKRLPLYPFSSLAAQAVSVPAPPDGGFPIVTTTIAAIAANGGRYFVLTGDPLNGTASETLMTGDELEALGSSRTSLITSGKVPDQERFGHAFASLSRMETSVGFARIARFAMSRPPVRDGIVRPNYLMASAAEEKRKQQSPGGPDRPW